MPPRFPTGPRPFRSAALVAGLGIAAIVVGVVLLWLSRIEPSTTGGDAGAPPIGAAHDHDALEEPVIDASLPANGLFGGNSARLIEPSADGRPVAADALREGRRAVTETVGMALPSPGAEWAVFAPARFAATPTARSTAKDGD